MALRTSLLIAGEEQGAIAALGAVERGLEQTEQAAKRAGAAANDAGAKIAGSTRAAQAGAVNLGRQVQDVAVQLQSGTNLGTIVAQQGGQVADALAQMGGRFGGLASFLAGPWGAAIIVGSGVLLNYLIPALFDTGEAADEAKGKTYDLSNGLNVLELSANATAGAMKQLAQEMRQAILVQGDFLRSKALLAGQAASDIEGRIRGNQAALKQEIDKGSGLGGLIPFGGSNFRRIGQLREQIKLDREALAIAREGAADASIATAQQRAIEQLDAKTAATGRYNRAVGDLNKRLRETQNDPIGASLAGRGLSPAQYEAEFRKLTAAKDAEVKAAQEANRKPRAERRRRGPDAGAVAARQAEFGEDIAARIAGVKDQFSDLPAVIAQSNRALRQLDDIASDVERKKPPNYAALRTDLADARTAIEQSLTRPLDEYLEKSREAAEIDALLGQGRDDEAAALQVVLQLKDRMKPLDDRQLEAVLATVRAERDRALVLRDQRALIDVNVAAVQDLRGALERTVADVFSGKFSVKRIIASIGNSAVNILSTRIVDSVFGDLLRGLEKKATSKLESAADVLAGNLGTGGKAVLDFAEAARQAISRIEGTPYSTPATGGGAASIPDGGDGGYDMTIPVTGTRAKPDGFIVDLLSGFLGKFGVVLPEQITKVMKDALARLEGGLKDILGGALTGSAASSLILGGKGSGIGGAVGGAIGQKLGEKFLSKGLESIAKGLGGFAGPLGAVAGGVIGGLVGGLFKKTKTGSATIGSVNGTGAVTGTGGNSQSRIGAARGLAGSGLDALDRIVEALGGETGDFSASIGVRKKKFVVDPTGRGRTKGAGTQKFSSEEEATKALLADVIADGAVKGVSAAVQRALTSSPDVEKALKEALKVQEVELTIGGIGAQLRKAFRDFERTAAERLRIGKQYGFDLLKLEERNAKDRLKLTEQLLAEQVGGLQRLIDELTSGSLFEGSAIDRRQALLASIATAKTDADAGVEGAADKLSGLLEQLNAVSKDVFATTGGFAADRASILDQARDTIARANQRITDAQKGSDPALATTNAALDENNDQNARIIVALEEHSGMLAAIAASTSAPDFSYLRGLAQTSAR